jgi:hypothetical protein
MTLVTADGRGNPNTSAEYANAIGALYGFSYAIKMSKIDGNMPDGYFDFVVPPLESLWRLDDNSRDFTVKDKYNWTAMLRLPDFVTPDAFAMFVPICTAKKPELDFSVLRFQTYAEGLVGQIMHIGPYDDEPATNAALERFFKESGYESDLSDTRKHHEIYLNAPRKTAPDKLKTIIRHPITKKHSELK